MATTDRRRSSRSDDDDVVRALGELARALDQVDANNQAARIRLARLQEGRRAGKTWSELVAEEEHPLIVELISENLDLLSRAGGVLRRAEACALHDEGLSMERIAELFGVTRQRVSALLRSARENGGR